MDIRSKFTPSPPKGTAADAKKNQDTYPRSSRKKDPTSVNNFLRNEQPRKFNVQRTKDIVKKPRAKGQHHGCAEENTKVVAAKWAERGSVLVHGSKKENHLLNGNHLLNFHYESRDVQSRTAGKSTRRYSYNSNRWLPPVQRHKYNKEQFLQASCQFVVTVNGNYSQYLTDPDILVDWNLIEQIKVHSSESLSCPICLCAPVAGKMTRCGHVYCWPCILHYIQISDKNDNCCKCPICYDYVHKNDLKSMIEITQISFELGDIIKLRLMRRERGSVLATPVDSAIQPPVSFLSVSENSNNEIYSKLLIASVKDIMDIILCERNQLECELKDNPDCYIEQALSELSERENKLLLELAKSKDAPSAENNKEITEKEIIQQTPHRNEINIDICYEYDTKLLVKQSSSVDSASSDQTSAPSKFIYFYQAEDGQHLYLHALNVKMLEMHYGDLEHCPSIITGKLLEREAGSYTEDLRKRLRYLNHLPLTCQFELAEIELKPPLISEEVLFAFREKLNLRQKRRDRRERDERKREKKITEEQNKRMGKYPTPNINIESQRHFPLWEPELLFSEERGPSSPELTTMLNDANSPPSSTFEEDEITSKLETDHLPEQRQGPSFAEMLRNTGKRAKSINTSPSVASSIPSTARIGAAVNLSNEDEDIEEAYYASPPSNKQCFGDAIARALEKTKLQESGNNNNAANKKKKKKGKTTVLFVTGMANGS